MKKIIPLSLITVASIYAAEVELAPIDVQSTLITEVAQNAQTSVDLAQALSTSVPSIDMSRRSSVANDIYIRGQKRDNISVEVDGTKVCGACPNRMDPPVSHVLASQIDAVEVIEGPYDVETFGTMSGGLKIKTKKPTKELQGELNLGLGQWGYNKVGASVSGGNDYIRVLVSGVYETSDQYEDGNGDTLAEQVKNKAPMGNQFQEKYEDMEAYTKKSVMAKVFINFTQDQELRLSYTANQTDDVLYPNTPMDALYDDSNIYSIEYNIKDLTDTYTNINLQYYKSDVDHPMGTNYRKAPTLTNAATGKLNPMMKNWLTTDMQGIKLKNSFDISSYKLEVGLDGSERKWDGHYEWNNSATIPTFPDGMKSIDDAVTTNMAIFAKLEKTYGNIEFSMGARFDSTEIENGDSSLETNDYTGVNANLMTTYNFNKEHKVFVGIGQANRVPDARELYFVKSAKMLGTPDLDQVTNQEIDLGYEIHSKLFKLKIKAFYSMLSNYIYIQKGVSQNAFQNIDASIYGTELSSSFYLSDDITFDSGISYKRGQKDEALEGQTDKDLADIAPLRANIALNYEYMNNSVATLELLASEAWRDIDSDNGEQELAGWGVVNLKVKHAFNNMFDFTLGVNNIMDKTYAQSNTYSDLTLVTSGTGDVMLLNEPGRYFYTNLDIKF